MRPGAHSATPFASAVTRCAVAGAGCCKAATVSELSFDCLIFFKVIHYGIAPRPTPVGVGKVQTPELHARLPRPQAQGPAPGAVVAGRARGRAAPARGY